MPKISVITPVYIDIPVKVDWLNEMILSVVTQTLTDWELILIDDKSPMLLDEVKYNYQGENRIRWLENAKNEGPATTRNTAVNLAQSECILPLDSDDMLANNEVLEAMYDAWIMDKSKTIYGNIQLYRQSADGFTRGKIHQLPAYSFEGAMHLNYGLMPVSTMHSKEAHYKAGGWKAELEHGREDLEYWIACGKVGFCGQKINHTTLLYRKHDKSRDYRLKELDLLRSTQDKIKTMHSDIYRGVFPMACCGKGGVNAAKNEVVQPPEVVSQQNQAVTKITELEGYPEKDLEWASYQGAKRARFDVLVRGPADLPSNYTIFGTGHHFQIHRKHRNFFSDRQHMGFRINQLDPRRQENETAIEPQSQNQPAPQIVEQPKPPQLSTLIRLDSIGSQTRQADIKERETEAIIEPNAPESYSSVMSTPQMPSDHLKQRTFSLSDLDLTDNQFQLLDQDGWTVDKLAKSTTGELTEFPGIGEKRAQAIISKARELLYEKSVQSD